MASGGVEEKEMQSSYAKPENEGLQPGGGIPIIKSSKGIHDLIFKKLQENPDPESGIQQAMKLLASMNEHLFRITKRIQERQYEERQGYYQLERLVRKEKRFRSRWRDAGKQLASLKRDLDKLTFANNAYKDKAAIMTEDNINIHNLHFLMHHGTNTMAKEKKLLKEMNGRQKKGDHCVDSGLSSVQYINDRIMKLRWDIRSKKFYMYNFLPVHIRNIDEDQVRKEITELKWARDKAFANAPVHGNTWNSLPSKNAIKQQIKFMEQAECEEDRKEHLQLRAEIGQLKLEINAAKKDISSLNRQLLEIRRKKGDAYKVILKLIKIQNQAILP